MITFEIRAGDFGAGTGLFSGKACSLPVIGKAFGRHDVAASLLSGVHVATEENVKKLGGTLGWGIVGGAGRSPGSTNFSTNFEGIERSGWIRGRA